MDTNKSLVTYGLITLMIKGLIVWECNSSMKGNNFKGFWGFEEYEKGMDKNVLQWFGYIERIENSRIIKKLFEKRAYEVI